MPELPWGALLLRWEHGGVDSMWPSALAMRGQYYKTKQNIQTLHGIPDLGTHSATSCHIQYEGVRIPAMTTRTAPSRIQSTGQLSSSTLVQFHHKHSCLHGDLFAVGGNGMASCICSVARHSAPFSLLAASLPRDSSPTRFCRIPE
jgi:hypothetical protein